MFESGEGAYKVRLVLVSTRRTVSSRRHLRARERLRLRLGLGLGIRFGHISVENDELGARAIGNVDMNRHLIYLFYKSIPYLHFSH